MAVIAAAWAVAALGQQGTMTLTWQNPLQYESGGNIDPKELVTVTVLRAGEPVPASQIKGLNPGQPGMQDSAEVTAECGAQRYQLTATVRGNTSAPSNCVIRDACDDALREAC